MHHSDPLEMLFPMVSFFAEVKIFRLWQKTMDYNKAFEVILCGLFTLHWKVLRSSNLHHSAPLEMLFLMVSFFAEVKIFRLWQKTMDYNKAFEVILCGLFTLHWKVLRAEICTILLLLRCSFRWYPFLPKSKFSDFGQKPWTVIRRFHQNRGHSLRSFYSSLEGATELKFAPFCSS